MKKNKYLTIITINLVWFVFGNLKTMAQESINTSGSNAIGNGGSVAYSIGQIATNEISNTSGNIAPGVQHAFEIFTSDYADDYSNAFINVYPNPASNNLTIEIEEHSKCGLLFEISDLNGKTINIESIINDKTQINLTNLPAATYIIKVKDKENKNLKTFKIVKK